MVVPRYSAGGGAAIPGVPSLAGGPTAPAGVPSPYATRYLQNIVDHNYRASTQAALSGAKGAIPYVFTGTRFNGGGPFNHHPGIYRDDAESNKNRIETQHRPVTSLMTEFDYFSTEKKKTLAKQLFMAGFLSKPDANLMDLQQAYGNLLSTAASRYAAGQQISPRKLLEQNIRYNLASAGVHVKGKFSDKNTNQWFTNLTSGSSSSNLAKAAGAGSKPIDQSGTFTQTSKSVDIFNPLDAKDLLRNTLQQQLGRDPSEHEMRDFIDNLTAAARNDPTITKNTQTTDKTGRVTNSSQVTHQGFDAGAASEMALENAQSKPGWAEWQAVGTYFPAVMQALGSVVPGA
jgi:hypothetical protein